MGTVGPAEKPLCKLDSIQKAMDQLKPGMVMTKTDDKVIDTSKIYYILNFSMN